jgi:succinate dehydrogenase / fumarate reductase iron-sulfur subunit
MYTDGSSSQHIGGKRIGMVDIRARQQSDLLMDVVLRVSRFTPKEEKARRHRNPFAEESATNPSPFGQRKRQRGKRWVQEYTLHVDPQTTILDCLLEVKRDIDPTLSFRYSCGHGMCGSDAVSINGTPTLLCTAPVEQWAKNDPITSTTTGKFRRTGTVQSDDRSVDAPSQAWSNNQVVEIAPLPGFSVQRDLISDIDPMLEQIKRLRPYLQAKGELKTTASGAVNVFEYLQSPEELQQYELLSNCIACGVCEGSCPVYAGGEAFIGPAALVINSRFINDSRDKASKSRLEDIAEADGIAACQSVRACSRHCPKGIDVGEEMWKLVERSGSSSN